MEPARDALPPLTIGIVGDRSLSRPTHVATEAAFGHFNPPIGVAWIATDQIGERPDERLAGHHGLLIAPGSPYRSMEGRRLGGDQGRPRGPGAPGQVTAHRLALIANASRAAVAPAACCGTAAPEHRSSAGVEKA